MLISVRTNNILGKLKSPSVATKATTSEDANVIWGARQDPGFGDTIKVMAIITGVGGTDLRDARITPDKLGDALKLTRTVNKGSSNIDFQRFD